VNRGPGRFHNERQHEQAGRHQDLPQNGAISWPAVRQVPKWTAHRASVLGVAWSRPSCSVVPSRGALRSEWTIGHVGHEPFAHTLPVAVENAASIIR
jgi:hypothetical protein